MPVQDVQLLEKLAHYNRERVPEPVVHAKGAGVALGPGIDLSEVEQAA